MGERCKADQTTAQETEARQGAGGGSAAGGKARHAAAIASTRQSQPELETKSAAAIRTAAGAARPPRTIAAFARQKEIDARIDLHGMTQTRAHRALSDFLRRAHADGLTFVLVITGKGRSGESESERGVLRRQVPQWLSLPEFRTLVVGFEEAHIGHGGEGALYVRIRRVRI